MSDDDIAELVRIFKTACPGATKLFYFANDTALEVLSIGKCVDPQDGEEEPTLCARHPGGGYTALYLADIHDFALVTRL